MTFLSIINMNIIEQIASDEYICGHFVRQLDDVTAYILKMVNRQFARKLVGRISELDDILMFAATGNYLSLLQFAHKNGGNFINHAQMAIRHNSIDCLKYIIKNGTFNRSKILDYAVGNGDIAIFKYLYGLGIRANYLCNIAAKYGKLHMLKYLRETGHEWDINAAYFAAGAGSLKCLQYCYENGLNFPVRTCKAASNGGHFDCLEYAHKHGAPITADTCKYAGTIECFKYAIAAYGSIPEKTCCVAVHRNKFDIFKYAYENGDIWQDDWVIHRIPSLNFLQYLYDKGHIPNVDASYWYPDHIVFDYLKFMHDHGINVHTDANFIKAIKFGIVKCIRFLHTDKLIQHQPSICQLAAASGNVECLKFVLNVGYTMDPDIIRFVIDNDAVRCLEYLSGNYPVNEAMCKMAISVRALLCIKYIIKSCRQISSKIFIDACIHENVANYLYSIMYKFDYDDNVQKFHKEYLAKYC